MDMVGFEQSKFRVLEMAQEAGPTTDPQFCQHAYLQVLPKQWVARAEYGIVGLHSRLLQERLPRSSG